MRPKMALTIIRPPRDSSIWRLRATAYCISSTSVLASRLAFEIWSAFAALSRSTLRLRRASFRGLSQRTLKRAPMTDGKTVPAATDRYESSLDSTRGIDSSCPSRDSPSFNTTPRAALTTHAHEKALRSEMRRLTPITRSAPLAPSCPFAMTVVLRDSLFCAVHARWNAPKPAQKVPATTESCPVRTPRSLTPVWGPPMMY
mmetsp:Transcript_20981/g.50994  ORF Transcript_20981/g.50994 Transcript_20981/m.50994 type:complete len:201 (-) Transcript_20981:896-1498(-)